MSKKLNIVNNIQRPQTSFIKNNYLQNSNIKGKKNSIKPKVSA